MSATDCVTGAFGYSGRYLTRALLDRGRRVRTLTGSPGRANPFGVAVRVHPLDFGNPDGLVRALEGVDVLYNTYWVRFDGPGFSHGQAVANSKVLFAAASRAGVGRVVHVSITNPSLDSPYPYFRGKAELERALAATGLPHTILRPAVFFGGPDILLNNIAWLLRHVPVFGIPGTGAYRLQPIHVEDFAALAVAQGEASGTRTIDATGPETFTYRELVQAIGTAIGRPRPLVRIPRWVALGVAKAAGLILGDVVLTRPELDALMDDLLATDAPPAGTTPLTEWLAWNAHGLGVRYASELARRLDRTREYAVL